MEGWRKVGLAIIIIVLDAFTSFTITWEVVALYTVFCGGNAVVHKLKNNK